VLCRLAISLYEHEVFCLCSWPWQLARCRMTNVCQKHNFSTFRRMPELYPKWVKPHATSESTFHTILPICCWYESLWESHSTLRNYYNTWSRTFCRQIIDIGNTVDDEMVSHHAVESSIPGDFAWDPWWRTRNLLDKIRNALWISV
jgi:hypothetical protein